MAEQTRNELVLAQNQHAFIQDETKGLVQVIVGPYKTGLTATDRPVKYLTGKYNIVDLATAISQNPEVPEGSYVVLENPAENDKNPNVGSQTPAQLKNGRKINIPGPTTFALWPGQVANVIQGHQLKSNQYIVVRVYNVDEAKNNWPKELRQDNKELVIGQLLVVKGTELSFFIPPTGLEVVTDPITKNQYVREAVTLERLEYCILLDENGNKRYERGPQVVFPTATEKFITRKDKTSATAQGEPAANPNEKAVKFKATELNDQMGIYVKVIADYVEEVNHVGHYASEKIGRPVVTESESVETGKKVKVVQPKTLYQYQVGDELFITGKVQRIYYPRPEHAIIEYGDDGQFKRQRYYGIAIPKGEARYVLDKNTGKVEMVRGETIFLPDPRFQVIVRRVLDPRTVGLWYPGNQEAVVYNQQLAALTETSTNYVQDTSFTAAMDLARSVNRGTRGSTTMMSSLGPSSGSFGDAVHRSTSYTPPPSLTLNTKYDGPPTINVFTGYAVQVVNKSGERRVVKGPSTILLAYDESLEKLSLSTGNPKSTDDLWNDVYLRVDHNKVSDTISVETKDMVTADVKVSYRVNFEGDPNKWFAVENYVKFMTDHCRSLVRSEVKKRSIKELIDTSSAIVRDTILGLHKEGKDRTGRAFVENGMRIYDIEVLKTSIKDEPVSKMIESAQQQAVRDTLTLTAKQREVETAKVIAGLEQEVATLRNQTDLKRIALDRIKSKETHLAQLADLEEEQLRESKQSLFAVEHEKLESQAHTESLARIQATDATNKIRLDSETEAFLKRMGAVDPKLTSALEALADRGLMKDVMAAVAPLALVEQQGIGPVLAKLFANTALSGKIKTLVEGKQEKS